MEATRFCNKCKKQTLHNYKEGCVDCKSKKDLGFEEVWNLRMFNDNVLQRFFTKNMQFTKKGRI